ncbi:MAG: hypothetical protein HIU86_01300 [Acidobacteria bacterium]|nr:hypothetical protein [Acidobacteriota bacterium]
MITDASDRDALVRGLLIESDLDPDDEVLLDALQDLHALGEGRAPLPSAAVATALAPTRARRRPLGRRGATVVVLIAAASLGTGLSAAASPAVRAGAQHAIEAIVHVVAPLVPAVGRGTAPSDVTEPGTRAVPPSTVPALPNPPTVSTTGTTPGAPVSSDATRSSAVTTGAGHGNGIGNGSGAAHAAPHPTATPPMRSRAHSGSSHAHGAALEATTRTVPSAAPAAHARGKGAPVSG